MEDAVLVDRRRLKKRILRGDRLDLNGVGGHELLQLQAALEPIIFEIVGVLAGVEDAFTDDELSAFEVDLGILNPRRSGSTRR